MHGLNQISFKPLIEKSNSEFLNDSQLLKRKNVPKLELIKLIKKPGKLFDYSSEKQHVFKLNKLNISTQEKKFEKNSLTTIIPQKSQSPNKIENNNLLFQISKKEITDVHLNEFNYLKDKIENKNSVKLFSNLKPLYDTISQSKKILQRSNKRKIVESCFKGVVSHNINFPNEKEKIKTTECDELINQENIKYPYEFIPFKNKNLFLIEQISKEGKITDINNKLIEKSFRKETSKVPITKIKLIEESQKEIIREDTSESSSLSNQSIIDFKTASQKVEATFSKRNLCQNNKYFIHPQGIQKESFVLINFKDDQSVDETFETPSIYSNYVMGSL